MAQDWSYPREVGDYYVQAITALYPTLRNGVDFSVARPAPGDPMVVTDATREQYMDTAAIDAEALALFTADPYIDYSPTGEAPTPPLPAPTLASLAPATAPALTDTLITATGTDFVTGCAVHIGATAATTSFVSATSVTFQTGASITAGAKSITVHNPDGQVSGAQTLTVT